MDVFLADLLQLLHDPAEVIRIVFYVTALTSVIVALASWITRLRWEQRRAALDYSLARNKTYLEARMILERKFVDNFKNDRPIDPEDIRKIEQDENFDAKIRYLLAHWEIMSISIFKNIIDEQTAYDMVGKTFVSTVCILDKYIGTVRATGNDRRFQNILALRNRWKLKIERDTRASTSPGRIASLFSIRP